jgi:hypothetical protein
MPSSTWSIVRTEKKVGAGRMGTNNPGKPEFGLLRITSSLAPCSSASSTVGRCRLRIRLLSFERSLAGRYGTCPTRPIRSETWSGMPQWKICDSRTHWVMIRPAGKLRKGEANANERMSR